MCDPKSSEFSIGTAQRVIYGSSGRVGMEDEIYVLYRVWVVCVRATHVPIGAAGSVPDDVESMGGRG